MIRRKWGYGVVALALLGVVLLMIASAGATMNPVGTFEAADGDLTANNAASLTQNTYTNQPHDWNTPVEAISCGNVVPNFQSGSNCGTDLTKSTADNAFGQGAKEDIPNPSEVTGSIPPNKSDLMRFYVNKEKSGGKDFLYLAWERSNVLGSANMDFEFNQSRTTPPGKSTPLRTEGDMLITFDFTNGGSRPVLGLLRWLTATGSNTAADCFSSNSLPCWGNREDLSAANEADGQVNNAVGEVYDSNLPLVNAPGSSGPGFLPPGTFGEAGINLTDAGVFSQTVCQHFGSAFLKSRSSASFTAELKDFIAPIPVDIGNCGALTVHKYIDINENGAKDTGETGANVISGDLTGWAFRVTGSNVDCSGTTDSAGNLGTCSTGGNAVNLSALAPGTYYVSETTTSKTIGSGSNISGSNFFNSDPGGGISGGNIIPAAPPVTKSVVINVGDSKNLDFGNTCYARAGFEVDGVPSGHTLTVQYQIDSGPDADAVPNFGHSVAMSDQGNGVWKAFVGGLRGTDSITWRFYIDSDTTHTVQALAPITLSRYPTCGGSGSVQFGNSTISGLKYKDINGDGVKQSGEGGLAGFTFKLYASGSNVALQTTTSNVSGSFSFANVDPGTYTIHEDGPPTGWQQTQPAAGGDVTVVVHLGDGTVSNDSSSNPIRFGNTPLSRISLRFIPLAHLLDASGSNLGDATKATELSCTDASGANVADVTGSNVVTSSNVQVKQSSVTCVVTYTDP